MPNEHDIREISIDQALQHAVRLHSEARFQEAERLYQAILEKFPDQADAHHNLGVLRVQAGKHRDALSHFEAALKCDPSCGQYWLSYADTLAALGELSLAGEIWKRAKKAGQHEEVMKQIAEAISRSGAASLSKTYIRGDFVAAEKMALELIALAPEHAIAWQILGASLMKQGRKQEALSAMQESIRLSPDIAESQNNLGTLLCSLGRYAEAQSCHLAAIRLKPNFAVAYSNLGYAQTMQEKPEEGEASCKRALELDPDSADASNNLALALIIQNKLDDAKTHCARAIEIDPHCADAYNNLGSIAYKFHKADEAEFAFRKAIEVRPDFAEAHNNLGLTLYDLNGSPEAEECYRTAIAINPNYAEAYNNLGNLLQGLGRIAEARASYEKALQIDPNYIECHRNLSSLKTFKRNDVQIAKLKELAEKSKGGADRMHACFALGKVSEDLGDIDESFRMYSEGNRLRKRELGYSIEEDRVLFGKIKEAFSMLPIVDPVPFRTSKPLLIVGMPRSGTSLVEQILASHSMVHGAGELSVLDKQVSKHFFNEQKFDLAASSRLITEGYFEALDHLSDGKQIVSDKMPQNFLWLGFLLLASPDLKVVHTVRDAMATCWSLFRLYFPANGMGFSYDLEDLGAYYKLYLDLMQFWRKKFPGRIYDLDYDKLTEDQEEETRKLLEYCGLPWETACLEFHATGRVVKTASAAQVRRKLYKGSSSAWKVFEAHLAPLKKVLHDNALLDHE